MQHFSSVETNEVGLIPSLSRLKHLPPQLPPHAQKQHRAHKEHDEAVQDLVVAALDQAVQHAQAHIRPGGPDPVWRDQA